MVSLVFFQIEENNPDFLSIYGEDIFPKANFTPWNCKLLEKADLFSALAKRPKPKTQLLGLATAN